MQRTTEMIRRASRRIARAAREPQVTLDRVATVAMLARRRAMDRLTALLTALLTGRPMARPMGLPQGLLMDRLTARPAARPVARQTARVITLDQARKARLIRRRIVQQR